LNVKIYQARNGTCGAMLRRRLRSMLTCIPGKIFSIEDSHFIKAEILQDIIMETKESLSQTNRCYLPDRINTGIAISGQFER